MRYYLYLLACNLFVHTLWVFLFYCVLPLLYPFVLNRCFLIYLNSLVTSFTVYFLVIFKLVAPVAARMLVFTVIVSCQFSWLLPNWGKQVKMPYAFIFYQIQPVFLYKCLLILCKPLVNFQSSLKVDSEHFCQYSYYLYGGENFWRSLP